MSSSSRLLSAVCLLALCLLLAVHAQAGVASYSSFHPQVASASSPSLSLSPSTNFPKPVIPACNDPSLHNVTVLSNSSVRITSAVCPLGLESAFVYLVVNSFAYDANAGFQWNGSVLLYSDDFAYEQDDNFQCFDTYVESISYSPGFITTRTSSVEFRCDSAGPKGCTWAYALQFGCLDGTEHPSSSSSTGVHATKPAATGHNGASQVNGGSVGVAGALLLALTWSLLL